VIYAGTDTLFTYPDAPLVISNRMSSECLQHLKPHIQEIPRPTEVIRWQESNLDWPNMTLTQIAKTFQADTILYVELERYTMVEEQSANLLRGRVTARVQVAKVDAPRNPVYETTVETLFPTDQPIGITDASEQNLRMATDQLFTQDVMQKFYDHEVEVPIKPKGTSP
jgi:hypothetical protein